MLKRMKALRNEKGLTLIELLVVIVILGIIAAIAIVAIGGILENSKKDNVVGSAQQMISAAKLSVAGGEFDAGDSPTIQQLQTAGYLDPFKGPNGGSPTGQVAITKDSNGVYTYTVTLSVDNYSITNRTEDQLLTLGRNALD